MNKVHITKSIFDELEYDTQEMSLNSNPVSAAAGYQELTFPTSMFVFSNSDLNAAAYHLARSLETPFAAHAVATVFLQESVHEDFIAMLQPKLKAYSSDVAQHQGFAHAQSIIERLKLKTVTASGAKAANSPTIVCDITHEQLGSGTTGVVTLHTFRTAKEAIALCAKESLRFVNATIWHENYSCAYELVVALNCTNFFVNCFEVTLEPLKAHMFAGESFVTIEKSYHYETFLYNGEPKNVVFPIGTIFAN